jgi:SPP1 gp7 family putative phage head morphogenesis protein
MPSVNDRLRDAAVRRQVRTVRVGRALATRIRKLVEASEDDLEAKLTRRLATIHERGFDTGPVTTDRLTRLLAAHRELNADLARRINEAAKAGLTDIALTEAALTFEELRSELPPQVEVVKPSAALIRSAVTSQPFQGRHLRQWVADWEVGRRKAVEQAIRIGIVQGETVPQMVRRIVGTGRLNFTDGVVEMSRRSAETLVRTAVTHVSARAREATFRANEDFIAGVVWVATLDARTCIECGVLDGQEFEADKGPRPPDHPACRCTVVPRTKSWRQLGIKADELDAGTRASMDGQVSQKIDFAAWLEGQPAAVQQEVLGATRFKLWQDGGLKIDRFTDARNQVLTLEELARRERAAFAKADVEAAA